MVGPESQELGQQLTFSWTPWANDEPIWNRPAADRKAEPMASGLERVLQKRESLRRRRSDLSAQRTIRSLSCGGVGLVRLIWDPETERASERHGGGRIFKRVASGGVPI